MASEVRVRILLVCAASGTGLTGISDSLKSINGDPLVKDLEKLVCSWHRDAPDEENPNPDPPKMDTVARRPRRELYETWRLACAQILDEIANENPSDPAVVSLHLTWYNPDTSEFFSPIDVPELKRADCSIDHVVILIDDIYDMFYRLREDGELYADDFMSKHGDMLRKLAAEPSEDESGQDFDKELDKTLQAQVIELALGELLSWRRSEMIQAENMAQSLGAKLTVLGTKHDRRALRAIFTNPDAPRIYLSHRITEHRRANMNTRSAESPLGEWHDVVDEVNTLHQQFLRFDQVLMNPTAIDELRYELANSRGRRNPHLGKRWPMLEPESTMLWSRPQPGRDAQHTHILTNDNDSDVDDRHITRSIASSLAHEVYFEIAFRDHVLVENTPYLCVYRPFFCIDPNQAASDAKWSSGVKLEIKHWKDAHRKRAKGLPNPAAPRDDVRRRIAFVHTTEEIRCRIRWLLSPHNYPVFEGNVRRHLEENWKELGVTGNEVSELFANKIPEDPPTHLGRSPEVSVVRQKPREVLKAIWPAVQIALHLVFTSLNRPGTEDDAEDLEIGLDQVALFSMTEDEYRKAVDLPGLVRDDLRRFFATDGLEEAAVDGLIKDFWKDCDQCFETLEGVTFEQYVAERLRIDYGELQRLASQATR